MAEINDSYWSDGNLNKWIFKLLQAEPFYAVISRYITKRENHKIPTARVYIDKNGYLFMEYNPEFFKPLTETETLGVLKHEFNHIIYGHLTERFHLLAKEDHRYWNIATDLAINSLLGEDQLPSDCLFPGKGEFKDMPKDQCAEWYLSRVRKDHEDAQDGQSDHSAWGDDDDDGGGASDGRHEIAEKRIKEMMEKAVKECAAGRGWGTVSEGMRKDIMDRIRTVIDWRKVLRFFVQQTQRADKVNSIRRINKRFPYIHPGRKILRHAKIAISVDQSGSVSDALLIAFFSELASLSKYAEFTVVPFDHEVAEDEIFVWKKGQKVKAKRVRCGGTNFDAPTRWVNERAFDGHIICTDMEAPTPIASKVKRLWATDKSFQDNSYCCHPKGERIIFVDSTLHDE